MLAEVAPLLIPQVDGLLVGMLAILGVVSIVHHFTRAVVGGIGGLLGQIPAIGKVLASPVNSVAHWIDHEFGQAEAFLDATFAWWLHSLGELVAWLGREIREQANLLYLIAATMVGPAAMRAIDSALDFVRHRALWAEHVIGHELERLHRLEVQTRHAIAGYIGAAVATALRPLEHELDWLERWVGGRGRALEHGVEVAIPRELGALRSWTRELEDEYAALFHRVARLERTLTGQALTGAVAIALAELGAGWIRCRGVGRVGRRLCGLPSGVLDGLLAGAVDVLLVGELCTLTKVAIEAAHLATPALDSLVDGIEELLDCQDAPRPPALKIVRTELPPVLEPVHL
jgi:hypothetical protein